MGGRSYRDAACSIVASYHTVDMRFKDAESIQHLLQLTATNFLMDLLHFLLVLILHHDISLAINAVVLLAIQCIRSIKHAFCRPLANRSCNTSHLHHRQPIIFGNVAFPFELSSKIFEQLDRQGLLQASQVSRGWYSVVIPLLWRSPRFYYKLDKHLSDIYHAPIQTMWSISTVAIEKTYILHQTLEAADYRHGYQSQLPLSRKPLGQYVINISFEFREHLVSDQTLADIAQYCPLVQNLSLAGCRNITDSGLRLLSRGKLRHSLKTIDLGDCVQVTDDGLMVLSQTFCLLQNVTLNGCIGISNTGIMTLMRNSAMHDWPYPAKSNLQEIYLRRCSILSGATIQYLAMTCGNSLQVLNLAATGHIGDKEIRTIAEHCSSLRHLSLARNKTDLFENDARPELGQSAIELPEPNMGSRVSERESQARENEIVDETIEYLVKHLQQLYYLDLSNITSITNQSAASISKCCHNLITLVLVGCDKITDVSLPFFSELHQRHGQLVNITLGGSNGNLKGIVNSIENDVNWHGWTHEPLFQESATL